MFDPHRMIAQYGLAGARARCADKSERVCVDAAAAMAEREGQQELVWGGLSMIAFPRRRLDDEDAQLSAWTRELGAARYRIIPSAEGIGVPFGSKARLILLWLHDQAIKTQSRTLHTGPSMHAWARGLGMEIGGMTYRIALEQLARISACRIAIARDSEPLTDKSVPLLERIGPAAGAAPESRRSAGLPDWSESKQYGIGQDYFDHILADPIRLNAHALGLIGNNCWAIDLYVALAYGLPRLSDALSMTWREFDDLYGASNKHAHHMKASFRAAVPLVKAIYKDARIDVDESGICYRPSPAAA